MINNYKLLTFIVCLKRYRVNSVIMRQPKYKLANKLSIHPTTFNKYLDACIRKGYIIEIENGWRIIKFVEILKDFCKSNKVAFNKHQILKDKNTNFGELNKELMDFFVVDNIILQQKFIIKKKSDIVAIHNKVTNPTGHNVKISRKEYNKYCKYRENCGVGSALDMKVDVVTSARHCSKKLGLSLKKANSVLNAGKKFKRSINYILINGCDFFTIESLRINYPKATLIPFVHLNKIKVCLGSSLILS